LRHPSASERTAFFVDPNFRLGWIRIRFAVGTALIEAHRFALAGFSWFHLSLPLQAIDGDNKVGSRKHLNQPVQEEFIIVRSGFEILFKDTLGFAHGFDSQLLIGHPKLHQSNKGL
jgi:hypothetical protein